MAATPDESEDSATSDTPVRPPLYSHQSSSLPSTPRQLARDGPFETRTPPLEVLSKTHSPRSASGDSSRRTQAYTHSAQTCRFMFTQVSRRRMPYSDEAGGAPLLPKPSKDPKSTLDASEKSRLSQEVSDLYQKLLPNPDNQARRDLMLSKLREIIIQAWPGSDFKVHVFGSSGNLLFNDRSDGGMRDVKCVHAKIRIVKIWDPELQLNCDLNVNNEIALTNTDMVKAYIRLDPRARPLAMIVKYWTRKRIINEASGGTLSSYTWTLLLINFLQTRHPPVLPCLALVNSKGKRRSDFSNDVDMYADFGSSNKETLGELIFHFFRRYAYEIDFEAVVVSVRQACLLSKREKGWHLATNNRLCVEEPFSVDRNLANTADDSAWRGLHLELRRAFDRLAEGGSLVDDACQQYDFLEPARAAIDRPQPSSRPVILTRSLSQSGRSSRGGNHTRGNRQYQGRDPNRVAGLSTRRASSAAAFGHAPVSMYTAPQMGIPLDLFRAQHQNPLQQQPQQASGLHNHLAQVHSSLRAREQELRQQAANLAQASAESERASNGPSFATQSRIPAMGGPIHARTPINPSTTSPSIPSTFAYPYVRYDGTQWVFQYPAAQPPPHSTVRTGASSPLMTPTQGRRQLHRDQYSTSPGATVRSHSQPARIAGAQQPTSSNSRPMGRHSMMMQPSGSQEARFLHPMVQAAPPQGWVGPFWTANGWALAPASTVQSGPREYLGYGIASPQIQPQYQDNSLARTATYDDFKSHTRHMTYHDQHPRASISVPEVSRSPSPMRGMNGHYDPLRSAPLPTDSETSDSGSSNAMLVNGRTAPLIVNGSYVPASEPYVGSASNSTRPRRLSESDQYLPPALDSWPGNEGATAPAQDAISRIAAYTPGYFYANQDDLNDKGFAEAGLQSRELSNRGIGLFQESPMKEKSEFATNSQADRLTPSISSNKPDNSEIASSLAMSGHLLTDDGASMSRNSTLESGNKANSMLSRKPSGPKGPVSPLELETSATDFSAENVYSSAKILSPVQETRTPSPTTSRKRDSREKAEIEKYINGATPSTDINGNTQLNFQRRTHPLKQASVYHEEDPEKSSDHHQQNITAAEKKHVSAPLPGREGNKAFSMSPATAIPIRGPFSNAGSANNNPWQQAGGKKAAKKARPTSTSQLQSQSESSSGGGQPMPVNASERKGG